MPNQANIEAVAELKGILEEKQNFVLLSFSGIGVNDMNSLRNDLRDKGIRIRIVKNNLFQLALKEKGYDSSIEEHLVGPNMAAFSSEELSGAAKVFKKYIKDKGKKSPIGLKMGVSDGVVYSKEEVEEIADLPTREELLAKIMGSINSPASGIAGSMRAVMSQLARAIDEVAKKNQQ